MSNDWSEWNVGAEYDLQKMLGHGSYGAVASARYRGEVVAVKKMSQVFDYPTDVKRAYREMHILRHLKHPHIIKLRDVICGVADHPNYMALPANRRPHGVGDIYLVFDYIDTDLSKIFKSNQFMSVGHVKYIMNQLLLGLKYLYTANTIHRDLKPANILISCADCKVKIADFGLARIISPEDMVNRRSPRLPDSLETDRSETSSEKPQRRRSRAGSILYSLAEIADGAKRRVSKILTGSEIADSLGPQFDNDDNTLHTNSDSHMLQRQLTHHVITRWYRAPEVILAQPYDAGVDIWSMGCIFAELYGMLEQNIPNYKQRKPIFPGQSCGELSRDGTTYDNSFHDGDQLNLIFDVLGTPNEEELQILPSNLANIIRRFPSKRPADLARRFPAMDSKGLSLLRQMLEFDPSKRINPIEALQHPFLADEYSSTKDRDATCAEPLNADIEAISENDMEHLVNGITEEVMFYRRNKEAQSTKA